ncbi:MAG: CbtA family protein [Gammaproteobacteria bacterium]|nr:CbtA family protein [Gammaproteobacteria bacterium]MCF6364347.1 CbtA family protein [Gammaproteobacteria bacterium]
MMLRTLLLAALMAGTISGILLTAIQQLQVTPLIVEAETYEPGAGHAQTHDHATSAAETSGNDENDQRLLLSLLSNVFAGIGFSLLVASAITLSNQKGWRKGLLWGGAGFIVFFAAPALGLPPKLPGTTGASLLDQQLWWISTAAASAVGIALLVFSRPRLLKGIGVLILLIPHIAGAPQPEQVYSLAPEFLAQQFVIASAISNATFWLLLGLMIGHFLRNLDDSPLT